ncbi:hypothetical protein KY366_01485 [Candidatus Woesearchaeota archaeon]|nr:hypothetical protein [Candidatus Woesearchaeota archaeon]
MRAAYIVALFMIVLMVGCATKQTEAPAAETPAAEAPAAETPEAPAVAETPTEAEAPAVVEGDIVITSAGFDQAEMTVKVGTTLAIKSAEGVHQLTVSGIKTPITNLRIEEGSAQEVTFDKVGKARIFDIFTKKSAYVTVTEETVSEAEE